MILTDRDRLIRDADRDESRYFAEADAHKKRAERAESQGYSAQYKAERLRKEIADEALRSEGFNAGIEAAAALITDAELATAVRALATTGAA